jgi:hypothetical protein
MIKLSGRRFAQCLPVSRAALDRGGNERFWKLDSDWMRHAAHSAVPPLEAGV